MPRHVRQPAKRIAAADTYGVVVTEDRKAYEDVRAI